jgi:hypothetical protein
MELPVAFTVAIGVCGRAGSPSGCHRY